MDRRNLLQRALSFLPGAAFLSALAHPAEARRRRPRGIVGIFTNIRPEGAHIILSMDRPDVQVPVEIMVDARTAIYVTGARVPFLRFRDDVYRNPDAVARLYLGLNVEVFIRKATLARKIEIDP